MTEINRRDALTLLSGAAVVTTVVTTVGTQAATSDISAVPDKQRSRADLRNGTYMNPVLAGDHPDPSVLKEGDDYYLCFSTFTAYPALLIWHSRDLVNWQPLASALHTNVGSIWAPELCKHGGRFYLYFAAKHPQNNSIYVIWADDIHGKWSEPVDLELHHHIDPGHAVAEDGSRWLFLSGGDRIRLHDDGLSTVGQVEHVYDPWRYPDDWDVESFSPEGPKITRHGKYFYLITAVGGTAGPPTGHMVIVARSQSLHGPWEHHPRNPVVRTRNSSEAWWSRGHATLVLGPRGDWWAMYHGFEKGYWTLGRQCLLAPVTFGKDEWPEFGGGDLSKPIRKPQGGSAVPHGMNLNDDFSKSTLRSQWQFFDPAATDPQRIVLDGDGLLLTATGASPRDSSALLITARDKAYEIECDIEVSNGARAGLILFYDHQLYCGLGFDTKNFVTHQYGMERGKPLNPYGNRLRMRLRNDHHIVSIYTSVDGIGWKRFDRGMEVSGYHHNVRGGFLMLRPGIYSAGQGFARFRNFIYRSL